MLKVGKGPFAQPGGDVWTETPDGVNCAYDDGEVRNSLMDARFVDAAYCGCGYDAFRNERYPEDFLPMGDDDGSTSSTTGTSSNKPIGRQR